MNRSWIYSILLTCYSLTLSATHIVGGELRYSKNATGGYNVELTMYKDCGPTSIGFPYGTWIEMYDAQTNAYLTSTYCYGGSITSVPNSINIACVTNVPSFCLEKRIYSGTLNYSGTTPNGVYFQYAQCCRNYSISNINSPGSTGMMTKCEVYPAAIGLTNSSPSFNTDPPTIVPSGDTTFVPFSATDADGDSLWYEFVSALDDDGLAVSYASGFSGLNPLPSTYPAQIDGNTGTIWVNMNQTGQYVVSVKITEYRNGTALSSMQRDYQFNVAVFSSMDLIVDSLFSPISCQNPLGNVSVSTVNGTAPYSYLWSTGDTIPTVTSLPPGTYTVDVIDSVGCQDSLTIELHDPSINLATLSVQNPTCSSSNDGWIQAQAAGQNGPFMYSLDSSYQSTGYFSGLSTGSYRLIIEDSAHYCIIDTLIQLTPLPAWNNLTIDSIIDPKCYGYADGAIYLSDTTTSSNYLWSDGSNAGLTRTSLSAGPHEFWIQDISSGCTDTLIVTIIEPLPVLISSLSITPPNCKEALNGSIDLVIGGGMPPYSYEIDSVATVIPINQLGEGNYSIRATDYYGCAVDTLVAIDAPNIWQGLKVDSIRLPKCYDGADGGIWLTDTLIGSSYEWLDNTSLSSLNRINIGAGQYYLRAFKPGCSDTITVNVNSPDKIVFDSLRTVTPYCSQGSNGAIYWSVSGGTGPLSVLLNQSLQSYNSATSLDTGIYRFDVSDSEGCTIDSTIRLLGQNIWHGVYLHSFEDLKCFESGDGKITLKDSLGGASLQWLDLPQTSQLVRSSLDAGTYRIRIYESGNCEDTIEVSLHQPSPLIIDSLFITPAYCLNDTAGRISWSSVGGTGSLQGQLGQNIIGTSVYGLSPGNKTLTITDSLGCLVDTSFVIGIDSSWMGSQVSVYTNPSCFGNNDGSIIIDTTGLFLDGVLWADTALAITTRDSLFAGTYNFIAQKGFGCLDTTTITLVEPDPIVISSIIDSSTMCLSASDGSIQWQAQGGNTSLYAMVDGQYFSGLISGLNNGVTSVRIMDSLGCYSDTNILISSVSKWYDIDTILLNNPTCFAYTDGQISLAIQSKFSIQFGWNSVLDSTTFISNVGAGSQSFIISSNQGCSDTVNFNLVDPIQIELNASISNELCSGDGKAFIDLSPQGGTGGYFVSWSHAPLDTSFTVTGLTSGTYNVIVYDSTACFVLDTFTIENPLNLQVDFVVYDETSCFLYDGYLEVNTEGGIGPYTYYAIAPTLDTFSISALTEGEYTLFVVDSNGCSFVESFEVSNREPFRLFIPNAFTPNGDMINDVFGIGGNPECFTNPRLVIKNYWGSVLFETNDPFNHFWDGDVRSQRAQKNEFEYYFISDEFQTQGKFFLLR